MVEGLSKKKKFSSHRGTLKKVMIIVGVTLGVVLIGLLLFLLNLPAPDVKQVQSVIGSKGRVEGSALVGSTVKLSVNNAFVGSSKTNENGEFVIEFSNDTEGQVDIAVTQSILFFLIKNWRFLYKYALTCYYLSDYLKGVNKYAARYS